MHQKFIVQKKYMRVMVTKISNNSRILMFESHLLME